MERCVRRAARGARRAARGLWRATRGGRRAARGVRLMARGTCHAARGGDKRQAAARPPFKILEELLGDGLEIVPSTSLIRILIKGVDGT